MLCCSFKARPRALFFRAREQESKRVREHKYFYSGEALLFYSEINVSRETVASRHRRYQLKRINIMNKEYMMRALRLAKMSLDSDDVPVGAVVVRNSEIIGEGYNRREMDGDPTAHAEIVAIKKAAESLGSWHLDDCELYITLEPCPMCAGAIINSRIKTVIFGAYEPKSGSASSDSVVNLFSLPYNHTPEVYGGICEKDCAKLITEFFKEKR